MITKRSGSTHTDTKTFIHHLDGIKWYLNAEDIPIPSRPNLDITNSDILLFESSMTGTFKRTRAYDFLVVVHLNRPFFFTGLHYKLSFVTLVY
jgi:hypothetical protein